MIHFLIKKILINKMVLIFLVFMCSSLFAEDLEWSGAIGSIYTQTASNKTLYLRPYAGLDFKKNLEKVSIKSSFRAFQDVVVDIESQDRFDIRELYVKYATDNWDLRMGAQLLSFSETFGLQIVDIANARDYSDAIFNELEWSKLSTWAINSNYSENNYSLQFIFSPYSTKDILPAKNSYYDISQDFHLAYSSEVADRKMLKDSEYGARLGHLFDNGIDFNILYYRHFNRQPSLELINRVLQSYYDQVETVGSTFSYALNDIVLRGDLINTFNDVKSENFTIIRKDNFKSILGLDYTITSAFVTGFQWHYLEFNDLYSASFFIKYEFNEYCQFDLLYFKGINNSDQWIQPKITLRWKDLSLITHADLISAKTDEYGSFTYYDKKDRIFTKLNYEF